MNKYLIVCTFRSGSTILASLLEEATGIPHLGEYLIHGNVTHPRTEPSLMRLASSGDSSDLMAFELHRRRRISFLVNEPRWIVRNPVTAGATNRDFIDMCVGMDDCELIFLYRRNLVDQFLSDINNAYRGYVNRNVINRFTKDTKFQRYDHIDIPPAKLKEWAFGTIQKAETWRMLYDVYRDISKLVCYEDHIINNDLQHIGIGEDVIDRYHGKEDHLIPTPYSTSRLANDDINIYTDFLDQYKYITDI